MLAERLDVLGRRARRGVARDDDVVAAVHRLEDKAEKGDHAALAQARADAAKDYLVKRHGIDAARIQVEARGDAEAGDDATRNRRAVVTVTFP